MKLSEKLSQIASGDMEVEGWIRAARELEAQVSQLKLEAIRRNGEAASERLELRAQVSQLTQERDALVAWIRRLTTDEEWVDPPLPAEPKWRADSARLGVTEAEVEKDLAPKETT